MAKKLQKIGHHIMNIQKIVFLLLLSVVSVFLNHNLQAADLQTNNQEETLSANKLIIAEEYINMRLGVNTLENPFFLNHVKTLQKQYPNKNFDQAKEVFIDVQSNKPEEYTISSSLASTVQLVSICKVMCDFTHSIDQVVMFQQLKTVHNSPMAFMQLNFLQMAREGHFKEVFAQTEIANFELKQPGRVIDLTTITQQLNTLPEDKLPIIVSQVNNNVESLMQQFEREQLLNDDL